MKIVSPFPDPTNHESRRAWLDARLGLPTASNFDKIITPKTMKYSAASTKYAMRLLAEQTLGYSLDDDEAVSGWAHRGTTMEREALAYYAMQTDMTPERVGFCVRDDGRVGASPDALVGRDGGLEIKCFSFEHHLRCLLGDDPAPVTQVQGGIWICEREWWDQLAYLPGMPPVLIRTYRDDAFVRKLAEYVDRFLAEFEEYKDRLDRLGSLGRVETRRPAPDAKVGAKVASGAMSARSRGKDGGS